MRTVSRLMLIALLAAGILACGKKSAGDGADAQVLATVNGTAITNSELRAFVREQTGGQEPALNPIQKASVVKTLVNMELLAQAARKSGMDKKPEVQADLQISNNSILAQMFIQDYLKQHAPTEDDIKAAYAERIKAMDSHEYKARHILVKDESEAKDIIAQLGKGASFAKLAKDHSLDRGSAAQGGELGDWFPGSRMVPEFTGALSKLKKGEITKQPVQSQYGWHVIQLEDVRDVTPPGLDQLRPQIVNDIQRKAVDGYLKQLNDGAKVVIAAPAAASAPAPATAAPAK
ncbi:MAG TPA: peptidylprolyl isomerase [Gammaproteobacteria bacterium]|nr:peptidylprolyl isomerase [Gammaproteobacteria bacterium]